MENWLTFFVDCTQDQAEKKSRGLVDSGWQAKLEYDKKSDTWSVLGKYTESRFKTNIYDRSKRKRKS